MKKLIAMIAAGVMGFAYGDGLKNTIGFEDTNYSTGDALETNKDDSKGETSAKFWFADANAEELGTFAEYGEATPYNYGDQPKLVEGAPGLRYLSLDSGSTILYRTITANSGALPAGTDIDEGLFFDSLVKFTVTEYDPTAAVTVDEGTKLAVWLGQPESDDGDAETNLIVTAAIWDSNAGDAGEYVPTNFVATVSGVNLLDGAWHRVTARAIKTVADGAAGFTLFIDTVPVTYDVDPFPGSAGLTAEAGLLRGKGQLFVNLRSGNVDRAHLQGFGFKGTGSIDDVSITDKANAPLFAKGQRQLTVTWDDVLVTALSVNGVAVDDITSKSQVFMLDEMTATLAYTPAAGYMAVNLTGTGCTATPTQITLTTEVASLAVTPAAIAFKIGDTPYATFADALAAASGATTIKLGAANVTGWTAEQVINDVAADITLDLARNTLTFDAYNDASILSVYSGKLTVIDSIGGGKIVVTNPGGEFTGVFYALGGNIFLGLDEGDEGITVDGKVVESKTDLGTNGVIVKGKFSKAAGNVATNLTIPADGYQIKDTDPTYLEVCAAEPEPTTGFKVIIAGVETIKETLAEALAEADDGTTIKMLGDMSGQPGVFVGPNKFTTGITIDFGGHTYEVTKPGAGSSGTETQAFHLESGNVITLKNGTIQCPAEMKTYYWSANAAAELKGISCMIMNYADLTIDSVVIDGSNLAPWYPNDSNDENRKKSENFLTAYTMSGANTGMVTLTGETTINARTAADFAFDTDRGTTYVVDGEDVMIGANVQLAAGNLALRAGSFGSGYGIIPTPGIIKIGTVTKEDGFTINTPVGYVWEENTLVFKPAFEGEGTEDNPWQIKAATDLQTLDQLVKAGTYLKGKCFKQMADINTGDLETWGGIGGMTQSNGSPYSFCGKYDGNNKTLTIPNRTAQKHAGGLFNSVDAGFEIKDITININYVVESGEYGIGAIAGYAGGSNTFTNCKLTGTIKCPYTAGGFVAFQRWQSVPNTYFVNCEVSASVEAKKKFGGFVGAAQGGADFTNCEFKGTVKYFGDVVSGSGSAWADGTCGFHDCTVSGTIGTGLYPFCSLLTKDVPAGYIAISGANKAAADHLANGGTVDGLNFGDTATIEDNLITLVSNDQIVIGGTNKVMSGIGTLLVTLNADGQAIAFDNALNTAFAATIIADGVVVTTNNEGTVTTYTAKALPPPTPTWPEDWPKDVDPTVQAKFDTWATTYGVTSFEGNEDAFLMNVDPEGTVPELKITSITVADDVATIVVDAGDADLATVNGVLFLDKSNDLKAWTTHQIPLDGEIKDGNWTVTVEGAKFMKAEVGFKAPAAE